MKALHDPIFDIFGVLPQDFEHKRRAEQIEFELNSRQTTIAEREAFELYYKHGFSVTEISDFLGITKSSASRRLSRFRQRCRLRYLYLTK